MRYLLLDRITELSPPHRASAIKCVSLADDVFVDHFPGHPLMPGTLVVEALAQLGGVLVEETMRGRGRPDLFAVLAMIDRARFREQVRPGDRLELGVETLAVSEDGGRVRGAARLDGKVAAEAELTYAFVPVHNARQIARRREVINVWLKGSADE
jgi:3-hydroxymyristoyl/3-hydroxydecanoyl-(acyl carrier protein) dehydratase